MVTKVFFCTLILVLSWFNLKAQSDSTRLSVDIAPTIGGGFRYDTNQYAIITAIATRCYYQLGSHFKFGLTGGYGIVFSSEAGNFSAYYFGPSIKFKISQEKIFYFGMEYVFENVANDKQGINYVARWPIYQYLNLNLGLDFTLKEKVHLFVEKDFSFITNRDYKVYNGTLGSTFVGLTIYL